MPIAELNGIRLSYQVRGTGPLVILVMGTGSPGRVWEVNQVPPLVDAGYRVVTVDNRGIAPSDECAEGFTIEYAKYDLITNPGALAAGSFAAWLSNWMWVPEIGLMTTFALLLFPTGHLPSRRWAVVGWLAAGGILLASVGSAFQAGALEGFDPDVVQNPLGLTGLTVAERP